MTSLLEAYKEFVVSEQKWYLPMLETVKSLHYFLLPGRFEERIEQSEMVCSVLNLVTLYNNSVLNKPRGPIADLRCGVETSATTRAKNVLLVMDLVQVLLEMLATSFYRRSTNLLLRARGKWRVILAMEILKSWCRFTLVRNNGWRMVVSPTEQQLEEQRQREVHLEAKTKALELLATTPDPAYKELINMYIDHGRAVPNEHGSYLITAGQQTTPVPSDTFETAGELVYLLRPLSYAFLKNVYGQGKWMPWLVSLLCDAVSRFFSSKSGFIDDVKALELTRRRDLYLFYLVRSPFFERFIKPSATTVAGAIEKIPLIGPFIGSIILLFISLQQHYMYIAASY